MNREWPDFATDVRLTQVERLQWKIRTPWYKRINWRPLVGGAIALTVSGLMWWAIISAVLYVSHLL